MHKKEYLTAFNRIMTTSLMMLLLYTRATPRIYSRNSLFVLGIYIDGTACDIGGVARDMFSAFWEVAYVWAFDGGNVLAPTIHPHIVMANLSCVGYYHISWLYFLWICTNPLKFPFRCKLLKGRGVEIPNSFLIESFMDYVSTLEGTRLHKALKSTHFSGEEQSEHTQQVWVQLQ